jgi:hypothetical protein
MESSDLVPQVFAGSLAIEKLRELGLHESDLVMAVRAAEIDRRSCSPLEPSVAPGFKAWAAGFRALAEQMVVRGWVKTETKGLPRVLNPTTRVAVAVISGDEGTGIASAEPKSKSPRGAQSAFLVRSNEIQYSLFEDSRFQPLPAEEEQITWWLLIYSDGVDIVRAELSLPVGMGEDRRLSVWKDRIIIELGDLSLPLGRRDDEEPPLEFEINIRPR